MSRSSKCCQHLNFGLIWTQGVKVKYCWALSINFLFSVQYKTDTKQNMVFSVVLLNGAKIQISLHYRILTRFHQGLLKSFQTMLETRLYYLYHRLIIKEEPNLWVIFFAMSVRKNQSRFQWQKRGLLNLIPLKLAVEIAIFKEIKI